MLDMLAGRWEGQALQQEPQPLQAREMQQQGPPQHPQGRMP
jgi:hypothetical protein